MAAISRGVLMRNSSRPPGPAPSASSGIGIVSTEGLSSGSVNRLGAGGEQVVEVVEPGLGELADLGVVDEDALHDARLELCLVLAERVVGGVVLELRDQQRAGAFELEDLVPVAL